MDGGRHPVSDRVDCVDRDSLAERSWSVTQAVKILIAVSGITFLLFWVSAIAGGLTLGQTGKENDMSMNIQGCIIVIVFMLGGIAALIALMQKGVI